MKKKILKIISFAVQGGYTVACIAMMIISMVFHHALGTEKALMLLDVLLSMCAWLVTVPALPISLTLNILAYPRGEERRKRTAWLVWIICSPIIYIITYCIALSTFVASTGI